MNASNSSISVRCDFEPFQSQAQSTATALGVDVDDAGARPYTLVFAELGVHLETRDSSKHGRIMVDFCSGSAAHRRLYGGGKNQMIAKAVGISRNFRPLVVDATAGLGKDAFVLAALGCELILLERSPVAFALLADGLRRAREFAVAHDADLLRTVERMTLFAGNSIDWLRACEQPVDVIYIDPMFPERHKQAAVKKDMQAFHAVIGQDDDGAALLDAANEKVVYRTVVKRPRLAAPLGQDQPSYVLSGKSSRYDIYTFKGVPKS